MNRHDDFSARWFRRICLVPANCKSWRISWSLSDLSEQYLFIMCLFFFLQTHFYVDLNLFFSGISETHFDLLSQKRSWLEQRSFLTSGVDECCQRSWVSVAATFFFKRSFRSWAVFLVGTSAPFFLKNRSLKSRSCISCCWLKFIFFWLGPKVYTNFVCVFPFQSSWCLFITASLGECCLQGTVSTTQRRVVNEAAAAQQRYRRSKLPFVSS